MKGIYMHKQSGMSPIGFLSLVIVIIFAVITFLRIAPVYIQKYTILQSIKSLNTIPPDKFSDDSSYNVIVIKKRLLNQLYINQIDIPEKNIVIKPLTSKKYLITTNYKVIKPLVGDMSLLFDFNFSREVQID